MARSHTRHTHHKAHTHAENRIMIDEIAYASKLRKVSPFLKLFVALFSIAVCLIVKNIYINLFILAAVLVFMTAVGKTSFYHVIQLMCIPLTFAAVGSIVLIFDIAKTPEDMIASIQIGSYTIGITENGIDMCVNIFVRCITASASIFFVSVTTPMTEIFSTLRRFHVPAFLAEIMELVYRYIFVLLETAARIRFAQECRLEYCKMKASFYSTAQLISNLFIRAYKQAERTYTAMESRGYTGEIKKVGTVYETSKKYIAGAGLYSLILIVLVIYLG